VSVWRGGGFGGVVVVVGGVFECGGGWGMIIGDAMILFSSS